MTTEFIISGVIGLLTGAAGSLVAPWMNWGIKKKEIKHQGRINLIKEVRIEIQQPTFNVFIFRTTPLYFQLKKHLSEKLNEEINIDEDDFEANKKFDYFSFEEIQYDFKWMIMEELNLIATKLKIE